MNTSSQGVAGAGRASPPARVQEPAEGKRARKKRETRQAIAEAALRLFTAQGYDATTLSKVSRAVGISPRTLYLHFKTKESTLDYWLREEFVDHIADALLAVPEGPPPFEAAREALLTLVAGQDNARAMAVDRLQVSNLSLLNHLHATTVYIEQAILGALVARWSDPADFEELRAMAMIASGILRLASDRWRENGYVGHVSRCVEEQFRLVAGLMTSSPSDGAKP